MQLVRCLSTLTFLGALAARAMLTITPLADAPVPAGTPALPLIAPGDAAWPHGAPTWQAAGRAVTSAVWLAATPTGLRLRADVIDPLQTTNFAERNLWRGDCLYLGIDARNDTTGTTFGPDDAQFIVGLGKVGEEVVGAYAMPTDMLYRITRDSARTRTRYDLTIPWAALRSAHGQAAAVGVAINVAHGKDCGDADLVWGGALWPKDGPRALQHFVLPTGAAPFITIAPRQTRVATPADEADVIVAVRQPTPVVVRATLGSATQEYAVAPGDCVTRLRISVPAAAIVPGTSLLAVTACTPAGDAMHHTAFELTSAAVAMDRFRARIERLLAGAPNDIVTQHLVSTLLVVEHVYRLLPLTGAARADETSYFIDKLAQISARLPRERFDWAAHLRQALPLVQAFMAAGDRSLQFYALQLPYGWQPGKAYPLTVYLHGSVMNLNPLEGLVTAFDNSGQDTLFAFADIDPTNVPALHRGFILAPWGRGNQGYLGLAEADVLQALDEVKTRFTVDADRQYLSGFSMGGGGAWGLAARTPDLWAGLNVASGFDSAADIPAWQFDNLRGLPIMLWAGALEPRAVAAEELSRLLAATGFTQRLAIAPDTPHTYPYPCYKANMAWLMQFTRPRPTTFSFETDAGAHPGRSGVRMHVPGRHVPAPHPRFTCSIEGQTVTITSENTQGLTVALGADGLDLAGDVTVMWNGVQAYRGPATTINLGTGAAWRPRR